MEFSCKRSKKYYKLDVETHALEELSEKKYPRGLGLSLIDRGSQNKIFGRWEGGGVPKVVGMSNIPGSQYTYELKVGPREESVSFQDVEGNDVLFYKEKSFVIEGRLYANLVDRSEGNKPHRDPRNAMNPRNKNTIYDMETGEIVGKAIFLGRFDVAIEDVDVVYRADETGVYLSVCDRSSDTDTFGKGNYKFKDLAPLPFTADELADPQLYAKAYVDGNILYIVEW